MAAKNKQRKKHLLVKHSSLRLMLAVLLGIAASVVADANWGWASSIVFGWDIGCLILILISWTIIMGSSPAETKERSEAEDPGRTLVFLLVSVMSAISLFASAYVLRNVKTFAPMETYILTAACVAAVTFSWILTHTAFTFRYARMYYEGKGKGSGLIFPGGEPPDDFDFAYFSFTLGMAFQTSDIMISDRTIRRTALFHSVLSFAYNTTLLALTLNIFFGML